MLRLALWSRNSPSSLLLLPSSTGGSGAPVGGGGNARMGVGISSRSIKHSSMGGMIIGSLAGLDLVPVLALTTSSSELDSPPACYSGSGNTASGNAPEEEPSPAGPSFASIGISIGTSG